MMRTLAVVMMVLTASLSAAEKAPKKPVGTWERSVSDHKITFTFNADNTMKISVDADGKKIEVTGEYGVTKDGVVFGVMTKVASDVGEGPEKGDLFSLSISATDKELTIGDLKGTRVNDGARKLVEGVYTKK